MNESCCLRSIRFLVGFCRIFGLLVYIMFMVDESMVFLAVPFHWIVFVAELIWPRLLRG